MLDAAFACDVRPHAGAATRAGRRGIDVLPQLQHGVRTRRERRTAPRGAAGKRGTASDLAPRPDDALIGRLVRDSARRLPADEPQERTRPTD